MNTIEDINKFLEQLLLSGEEQVHNICFLMLNSRLRLAQIIDIKFSDINFTTGILQTRVFKISQSDEEKVNIYLNDASLKFLAKIRYKYPNDIWAFQSKKSDNRINKQPHCLSSQAVTNIIELTNQHLKQKISFNSMRHTIMTNYSRDI